MQDSAPKVLRLFLLRHARSGWALPGQRDFDRSLDETGYIEAERLAQLAADQGIRPERILCSTAARCRETAEPFFRTVSEDLDIRYIDALYSGPTSVYFDLIDAHRHLNSLMLVGHNPMIEQLLYRLIGDDAAREVVPNGYPPAGLAIVDVPSAIDEVSASATLVSLLLPSH
ncbi:MULTISPECIES: histidine phosphatase family protein [unclassified Ensifer]|uniref:SixA phosphatase family protein n=1 Tax=unclassified Ensifer TaxID=2633371 RepID=UPI0008135F12|nr:MULTISPECIES: histidine phosphatase family protein [unclassified Ensifer]OCP03449.1 phosphohistidine phosphatase [Ensifer sp. LC11]OCP03752.1 phosphohistidine phosphatase [Ensifer sp. LC13]OCP08450.1 phosphohistidine phosphatase [Ensifer sp. LC14]OCP30222.1 phosphohistidine phosphatase [Ensifer sp. LC499]